MKKTILVLAFVGFFGLFSAARAQEATPVADPKILPDNPVYFLKDWARNLQSFLTQDPLKNAELRQRFLDERIAELEKLAQKSKNKKALQRATENIKREAEKLEDKADEIKDTAQARPELGQFLDKLARQTVLHQKILEKLENQVPPEVFQKIAEARQSHLEKFGQVMLKLENKESLGERLKNALNQEKDYQFKRLDDLELLDRLSEKLPEDAKEKIISLQKEKLENLKRELESLPEDGETKLRDHLEKGIVNKERQLKILEGLKTEARPALEKVIEKGKERVLEKIQENAPVLQNKNCPLWVAPAPPDFCKNGRLVVNKDANGCLLPAKCVVPGDLKETKACITLWDPVCGTDNKTYSNKCFAGLAGVEVVYRGECQKPTNTLPPVPAEKL
jgi:hypothetical protein